MSNIAIKVENLSKKYLIGSGTSGSLRETLSNAWHNTFGGKSSNIEEFWALKDISFELNQGEAVGIIGRNGAGKSTLLKVISKITYPTTGKISMNGRVSSLLEVGTGFHPELTGRENIFLNGTILGMSRKEVKSKFDEIVDFSGVEKFLDTPVKRYSSGMYVRLAFAVAAHLEPEILIIDEVLAVGDAEFQKKCLGKMGEVAKGGRTVIFVSHNMSAINNFCTNGILLENGKLTHFGEISEVVSLYMNNKQSSQNIIFKENTKIGFTECLFNHKTIEEISPVLSHDSINISVKIKSYIKTSLTYALAISDESGNRLFANVIDLIIENEITTINCELPPDIFLPGHYYVDIALIKPGIDTYDEIKNVIKFEIIEEKNIYVDSFKKNFGLFKVKCNWEIK